MRIWQVTLQDTQTRFWWFATGREATRKERELRHLCAEEGGHYTIEVEEIFIAGGKRGLVDAMNWVIDMTCFNEG